MNIFKRIRSALRFNEAVRQADKAHRETGERYYVMPNGNTGKLLIMDRFNFRKLKQKGYINRKASVSDLEAECFYCTPYSNGTGELPHGIGALKRKEYMDWLVSLDRQKKHGKQVRQEAGN